MKGIPHLLKEHIFFRQGSYEKATELSSDIIQVHLALGECYFNKGETEKALDKRKIGILIDKNQFFL